MVALERFIDKTAGTLLSLLFGVLSKPFNRKLPKSINNILIIKLWAIGDSIITLPMIDSLKKRFPKSKITILVKKRNYLVYKDSKDIDHIELFESGNFSHILALFRKFDVCMDLEPYLNISALLSFFFSNYRMGFSHGARSLLYSKKIKFNRKQHMVQNYLDFARAIGAKNDYKSLIKLSYSKHDEDKIKNLFREFKLKSSDFLVGISLVVAESVKSREWPKESFAKLAISILSRRKNAKIVFVGLEQDKQDINQIINMIGAIDIGNISINRVFNFAGKTNLSEFFCIAGKFDVFVSNDTGTMHIAAAQGVKTIGLFGPNIPALWAPYGPKNIPIYKGKICPYSPCIRNEEGLMPKCYNKDYQICMKNIKVEDVLRYVK